VCVTPTARGGRGENGTSRGVARSLGLFLHRGQEPFIRCVLSLGDNEGDDDEQGAASARSGWQASLLGENDPRSSGLVGFENDWRL
jgi:hypothetical protein